MLDAPTAVSPVLDDELELLRSQVRRFVEECVKPHADEWEQQGHVPRTVLRDMGEIGLLGIRYPGEYGGSSMDCRASVILAEELGRSTYGGFAITVLVHTDMASPHLANFGSEAQQHRWMAKVISGECITAVAVTEPDAGSDVAAIRTTARQNGNGGYVLNGAKMFVTNGALADLYFVAAKTNTNVKGSSGISIFAVEKGSPGLRVGQVLTKHGWLSSDTAELILEDCIVPEANLLGVENRGFYSIVNSFQNERLVMGAMAIGEAQAAISHTLEYLQQRRTFGTPLWSKQAIRQRMAMLSARIEAGRQLVYSSAWLAAQGRDCVKEVSMVKAYCGELVNDVVYDCLQFHGGTGYIRGSVIERMARDARIHSIGGGATEIMLEEICKRMP